MKHQETLWYAYKGCMVTSSEMRNIVVGKSSSGIDIKEKMDRKEILRMPVYLTPEMASQNTIALFMTNRWEGESMLHFRITNANDEVKSSCLFFNKNISIGTAN